MFLNLKNIGFRIRYGYKSICVYRTFAAIQGDMSLKKEI